MPIPTPAAPEIGLELACEDVNEPIDSTLDEGVLVCRIADVSDNSVGVDGELDICANRVFGNDSAEELGVIWVILHLTAEAD